MTFEMILTLLIGGGGTGALISAFLTRKSAKESTDIQLLDRAYKEIERLDSRIDELEEELRNEKGENTELKEVIREMREVVYNLKQEIERLKEGR